MMCTVQCHNFADVTATQWLWHKQQFVAIELQQYELSIGIHMVCHPDGYYWGYFTGAISLYGVPGRLWGESTGHRWIPLTKASDADLLCILWFAPEQTVEQTIETLVNWVAIALIMMSL